jgi:hypothetical protein
MLFPELVKKGGSALGHDVCDPSQLCIPCNDPSNGGADTGMCGAIGVMGDDASCSSTAPAPASDAGTAAQLAKCCTKNGTSNGVCIDGSKIPEAQRSRTKQDTCTSGDVCVPAAFVSGKPVTCTAGIMGKGVCMDGCFDEMMSFAGSVGILERTTCGSTELCIPCSFVSGQGVPGCP